MNEEKDWLFEENELLESIRRFEEMQKKNLQYFFDVHELENIINYYFDLNDHNQASIAAQYAFQLYPESAAIQLKFAHHLIFSGKPEDSIKLLNYIEKAEGPGYEVFVLKGTALNLLDKTTEARSYFDRAVSLSDENKDEVLYNIGISFEDRAQYDVAIDYFKEAYKLNPDNVSVLYDLAYSTERAGSLEDSVYYYNKYLDEDPYSENVWYNLGIIYTILEKIEDALEAYDYAIAINEGFSSAYFNKGNLLFNEERFVEAIEVYKLLLELEPENPEVYNFIGECYNKTKEYNLATSSLEKSIQLNPALSEAWHNLSSAYYNTERYEEALKHVNHALSFDIKNTEYLFTQASILYKLNELKTAMTTFKTITELDPTDEEAWMFYSEIQAENSQLDDAIKTLTHALGFNEESSILNYRIGSYYMLKGNKTLSYKYFEKGLKLNYQDRQFFFDIAPDALHNPKIIKLLSHYN